MNSLIKWSIEKRWTALILSLLLCVGGFLAFKFLPIDAVPDITNIQVVVNTEVPGLVPEEIERNVTFPVEVGMQGIAGVTQIRSITRFGLSQVTIIFQDGTNLYRARQLVSERLAGLTLTNSEWKPQLGPITTGLGEIFHYVLDFKAVAEDPVQRITQMQQLRAVQDWWLKPRLLSIKGIAEVNTIGGYEKEFHILPDKEKMAQYGLSFRDLEEALSKVNRNVGGAYVQQTAEQFLVQGRGLFSSIEDIKRLPLRSLGTLKTLRVSDVAEVRVGEELRRGAALYDGREAVLGTALMLLGENSRVVSARISNEVDRLQSQLPEGMQIIPVYNRSQLVDATLNTVQKNLALGGLLVVVILMLLLGNFRAAIITAVIIPFSLLGTFIGMKTFGFSGNLMSLGALDFGIIVDGAVIVMDNIVRVIHERGQHWKRRLTDLEVRQAILDATIEIRKAAGFGQLIIVMIFLPIILLDGVAGKMFRPMAATFAICLFIALILSFTLVPALAALLMRGDAEDKEPVFMLWTRTFYEKLQAWTLKYRKLTLVGGLLSFLLGVVLFARLGGEFIPQLDEGTLAMEISRPVNTSLEQSVAMQAKTDQVIRSFQEVDQIFSRLGTAKVVTDPAGMHQSDTFVSFHPKSKWPKIDGRRRTKNELLSAIKKELELVLPGQRFILSQPIQMRFNELIEGTRADVSLKIFGPDMDELVHLAGELRSLMLDVPGAGDVAVDLVGTSRMLQIEPKKSVMDQLGLSPNEVLQTVEIGMGGKEVGSMFEAEKRFPVLIRLNEESRRNLESLEQIPVPIGLNATRPLVDLAEIRFAETYGLIAREDSQRRTTVLINPRGRDTESFVRDAQALVESKFKLPFGYRLEWGGDFKKLKDTKKTLSILTPLVLLAVFLMVYAAFRNLLQTALVFLCVPLSLVGGVLALNLKSLPFSISAGVGFIALSGIAVLNGVVLVSFFNELKMKGRTGLSVVREGTLVRLRPVLMTALVDVFGFLPMMFASGAGAEIQRPLAAVVVGGIISSTVLTLLVLPALYYVLDLNFAEWMQPAEAESEEGLVMPTSVVARGH